MLLCSNKRMEPLSPSMHLAAGDNSFAWRFKRDWLDTVTRFAEEIGHNCYGAKFLEVGAGIHNPLGCALLSLADGAALAAAVEPGDILPEHLDHAIFLGLLAEHCSIIRSRGLQISIDSLMSRATQARLPPENGWVVRASSLELFRGKIEDYPGTHVFDIVHSNAVIEHVFDLPRACARLYDLTAEGGIHLHKVDFIDHRYYTIRDPQAADAFRFLLVGEEGKVPDCNGLRLSEVIETFVHSGFEFVAARESWQLDFPAQLLPRLQHRYQNLSCTDLRTTCATLLFRRPRAPTDAG